MLEHPSRRFYVWDKRPIRHTSPRLGGMLLWGPAGVALLVTVALALECRSTPAHDAGVDADMADDTARSLEGTIELYGAENHELPLSLDALTKPSGKSNEPFFRSIPKDPWGNAFQYRVVPGPKPTWTLRSAGEDGRFGTDDDIVRPKPDSPR